MKVNLLLGALTVGLSLAAIAPAARAQDANFTQYCGTCHTPALAAGLVARVPADQRADFLATRILARHAPVPLETCPELTAYLLAAAAAAPAP